MADDIVTRLRLRAAHATDDYLSYAAADEIERLRAAGDELFAALNLQFAHIIPDDVEWAAHAEHCQFATRAWQEARRG